jgi:hypothetical protein
MFIGTPPAPRGTMERLWTAVELEMIMVRAACMWLALDFNRAPRKGNPLEHTREAHLELRVQSVRPFDLLWVFSQLAPHPLLQGS